MEADLKFLELAFVPVEQVEDLRPARLFARQPELPADTGLRLEQIDAVAALGGGAGGLKPGRTGAHDDDMAGFRGRREAVAAPFELAPRRGVDEAGDPVIARPPPPAHLVAGDAAPHIPGPPLGRLARQMRIGDLAPHDGDHIRLSRGNHAFGVLRRPDMRLRRDPGVFHNLLQFLGEGRGQLVGV